MLASDSRTASAGQCGSDQCNSRVMKIARKNRTTPRDIWMGRSEPAKRKDHETDHRVGEENIAVPQQVRVEQSDQQQHAHPPVMHAGGSGPGSLAALRHEHDTRTEQHAEDRHELAGAQQMLDQPDPVLRADQRAVRMAGSCRPRRPWKTTGCS